MLDFIRRDNELEIEATMKSAVIQLCCCSFRRCRLNGSKGQCDFDEEKLDSREIRESASMSGRGDVGLVSSIQTFDMTGVQRHWNNA